MKIQFWISCLVENRFSNPLLCTFSCPSFVYHSSIGIVSFNVLNGFVCKLLNILLSCYFYFTNIFIKIFQVYMVVMQKSLVIFILLAVPCTICQLIKALVTIMNASGYRSLLPDISTVLPPSHYLFSISIILSETLFISRHNSFLRFRRFHRIRI